MRLVRLTGLFIMIEAAIALSQVDVLTAMSHRLTIHLYNILKTVL